MGERGAICRLGVFYDGSFFSDAQNYYYYERQLGWLCFPGFHHFLEKFIGLREPPIRWRRLRPASPFAVNSSTNSAARCGRSIAPSARSGCACTARSSPKTSRAVAAAAVTVTVL